MEEQETNTLSYRSVGWRIKKSEWLTEKGKKVLRKCRKTSVIAKIFEMSQREMIKWTMKIMVAILPDEQQV